VAMGNSVTVAFWSHARDEGKAIDKFDGLHGGLGRHANRALKFYLAHSQ